MNAVKIAESAAAVSWDYDEAADVLDLSFGEPRPAVGVELGNGLVLRYDEARDELAGLTVIGLRERLRARLNEGDHGEARPVLTPRRARGAAGAVGGGDNRRRRARAPRTTLEERRRDRRARANRILRHAIPGVRFLTREEGRQLFDFQARKLLNISGDEFLQRWDAGEYGQASDTPERRKIEELVMLMPFARRVPA